MIPRINEDSYKRVLFPITIGGAVSTLVGLSYLIQFFGSVTGSYLLYRVILSVSLLLLVFAKKNVRIRFRLTSSFFWILMLVVIAVLILFSGLTIGNAMDWYTYFVGVVFLCSLGEDENVLRSAWKVMVFFGVLYASSIWIQLLLPQVYTLYLRLLPAQTASRIQNLWIRNRLLTGFSTNPGFAAGHIISAILVQASSAMALKAQGKKTSLQFKLSLILLFSALLLTGKRGHLLAFAFSVILCILLNSRGKKRVLVLNVLLTGVVVLIPFLLVFSEVFSAIPVLGRLGNSIVGWINGDDVTSGRSKLFAFAYSQFLENPILGIGWGNYRASVIGTVTIMTELDVHNIYIQLLCETGVVGFIAVIVPMAVFLFQTKKNLDYIIHFEPENMFLRCVGLYSLAYQLFFFAYGISGNPLYDYNYVIMYFISCAISALIHRRIRKGQPS